MATRRKQPDCGKLQREDNPPHRGKRSRGDDDSSQTRSDAEAQDVPVVREEVVVGKKQVEQGRVRVTKKVTTSDQTITEPVFTEEVDVVRVPVNRALDRPATVRSEGDLTIVPIMEEVVVVEKRLMLREELHIRRRRTESVHSEKVRLREEHVDVQRLPANGKAISD